MIYREVCIMSEQVHKRRWLRLIIGAIFVFLLMAIGLRVFDYIVDPRNGSGIYLSDKNRVLAYSSPSSWLGDGEDYDVYRFSDDEIEKMVSKIEDMGTWKACPVDVSTSELIDKWRYFMENEPTAGALIEEAHLDEFIPAINNGYYLVLDRSDELRNYSIFLLDIDGNTLYYFGSDM